MGRWLDEPSETPKREVTKPTEPKRQGFREVEQVDLVAGWQQIVAGEWKGIGVLNVQDDQHVWGGRIIIAEPGANRDKLAAYYPGLMIFTPQELRDAVDHWPENAATVQAKKTFQGDIQGVA